MNEFSTAMEQEDRNLMPIWGLSTELQGVIKNYTQAFQCSRDIVTSTILCLSGITAGKKVFIMWNGLRDYPIMFLCHVSRSGSNKTAPVKKLLEPLLDLDEKEYLSHQDSLSTYRQRAKEGTADESDKPKLKQLVLNDVTPESLYSSLASNGNGLLLYADEIRSFLRNMDRYHSGDTSSQLLSIWSNSTLKISRKGEELLQIREPNLSILGGVQPSLLNSTFGKYLDGSGFFSRWLFAYPIEELPTFTEKVPLGDIYTRYWRDIIFRLSRLDKEVEFTLSDEAQEEVDSFVSIRKDLVRNSQDGEPMAEYWGKSQVYIYRLLPLVHLIGANGNRAGEIESREITKTDVEYCSDLMLWFESSAARVLEKMSECQTTAMRTKDLLRAVYSKFEVKSISGLAYALGVSQPYVTKCLRGIRASDRQQAE